MARLQPPATPLTLGESFGGGLMIGMSAALFLYFSGRRTGISGILSGVLPSAYKPWKVAFLVGFVLVSLIISAAFPSALDQTEGPEMNWVANVIGGLLVGFGTKMGNGCTSGHGVCGLARGSRRGLVATCTFMAVGFLSSSALSYTASLREPAGPWDRRWGGGGVEAWWNWVVVGILLLMLGSTAKGLGREAALAGAAALCGGLFALGLVVGRMSVRQKVLNFLWLSESWDPSLAFVMGGAVLVNTPITQYLMNKPGSVARVAPSVKINSGKSSWEVSKAEVVDTKLVAGAALFGLGWGIAGLCPGPSLVLWTAGYPKVVLAFLPCMILGMAIQQGVEAHLAKHTPTEEAHAPNSPSGASRSELINTMRDTRSYA